MAGSCLFKISIFGCKSTYSNSKDSCADCMQGYRKNDSNKCDMCDDDNCFQCDDAINKCNKCKSGYSIVNVGTAATCKELSCEDGCVCKLGECTACMEGYGK